MNRTSKYAAPIMSVLIIASLGIITYAVIHSRFDVRSKAATAESCLPTVATSEPICVPSADANFDGKVDGLDYVVWLINYDTNTVYGPSRGDFNVDGNVDGVDYVFWLTNYEA